MSQPNLPSHWKLIPLGELSNIQSGGTPSREKPEFYGGQIKWVKTLDLNEGIVRETEETINELGFQSIRGKLRPVYTVMVAMYGGAGTVGKSGVLGVPATTNQAVCCIEPNLDKFDSFYLLYHLIYLRPTWMREAIGTRKDPNISKGIIENTKIPLPPLPEQRAIAHTLLTIQKAKEARQRELELERERKAALMQYLFTHGTRNEPRKKTEIGEIPQNWQVVKLGQVSDISTGTTPSTKKTEYYEGSIPFVKTSEIINNRIYQTQTYISKQAVKDYNLKIYPPGSVFLAMYGQGKTRGQVALLEIEAATTQNTAAIQPSDQLDSIYLWQWLISQYSKLREAGSQGQISHLNLGYVKAYKMPCPSPQEQSEIADILQACDRKITALEQEVAFLDELFRAMLEELMTGRLSALPLVEEKAMPENCLS